MSKKDELSPEQLEWLVSQRSDIQKLCLKVYGLLKTHEEVFNRDKRLGDAAMLCVGAAFSLWRGVFLAPDQFEWKKNFDEGLSYLYDAGRECQKGMLQCSRALARDCRHLLH